MLPFVGILYFVTDDETPLLPLHLVTTVASGTFEVPGCTAAMWATVPGRVMSKSNFRKTKNSSWQEVAQYETLVAHTLRAARPAGWPGLEASQLVVGVLAARTGLDAANISKSVLDAGQGVLYVSDAQVRSLTEFALPARADLGLFAAFGTVSGNEPGDIFAAQIALSKAVCSVLL